MYRRQSGGWVKHYDFILIDLICLHLSFVLSYIVRHGWSNPYTNSLYGNMAIFVTLADITSILLFGSYSGVLRRRWKKGLVALLRHTLTVFLLSALYLFTTQEGDQYSRITLYLMWVIYFGLLFLAVSLWKYVILHRKSGTHRPSLLVVTTADLAQGVAEHFSTFNFTRVRLCGIAIVDRDMTGEAICGIPVVANQNTVKDYVLHEWVDEVFTCFTGLNDAQKKLVNQFIVMGVTVHEKLNFRADEMKNKQFIEKVGNYTVLTTSINYATAFQAVIKRVMD
ncbi:MAG: sugar transferase, partial [Clostridia bacterium]|nr:sugar transferase [Clostridia bacterium]